MSAQAVPTTYISNKNNDKFAALIDCDLSSEDDICLRRNTVTNQQYKTNLNLKSCLSNEEKKVNPEINFNSADFHDPDYFGMEEIPSVHKIDSAIMDNDNKCT